MRTFPAMLALLFVVPLAAGCPGGSEVVDSGGDLDSGAIDAPRNDDGGSGDDGGTADDGGSADDGGTADDGGSAPDGGTADDGGSAPDGGTVTDAGPGSCTSNADCPIRGAYCAHEDGMCDAVGRCEREPLTCPRIIDPVCGCDGVDYTNPCLAAQAGVSVASSGMCGTTTCDLRARTGCCFEPGDCGRGTVCTGEPVCRAMSEGSCETAPAAGECWSDDDCARGTTCEGAITCPCMLRCTIPPRPGTCR